MDEVSNQSEVKEAALPETSQQEATSSADAPVTNNQEAIQEADKQERNWQEMRRIRRELEQKIKMQEELLARVVSQAQPTQPQAAPAKDETELVPDEDYIPKGQVKKLIAKEAENFRKAAKEEAERLYQEKEKSQFLTRIKSEHPDFDDHVNPETLALLEEQNPRLASVIAKSSDPYDMALQSYEYIKAMGLAQKVPSFKRSKEVDKKLEQNAKTIQTPQAFEKRPMAQAFKETQVEKDRLYAEMMNYAHQAGGGY